MKAARTKRADDDDPTFYPVEGAVGEDLLQRLIAELFRPLLAALLASRGEKALVGADQYIYWERYAPTKVVSPDIYVLPGVDPRTRVRTWKVWQTGIAPSFALEIMSADEKKDVEESPARYDELGTAEVVIFDPEHDTREDGVRFRIFRRLPRRGLVLVEATNADRVRSKVLRCFLRSVGKGDLTRLRIGLGKAGDELLPTEAERAMRAERAKADAERAKADADRHAAAEIAGLRAEIAALKRGRSRQE